MTALGVFLPGNLPGEQGPAGDSERHPNAKDFGAKADYLDNGTINGTDNRAAIQAMLDSLQPGETGYLTKGMYRHTGTLIKKPGTRFIIEEDADLRLDTTWTGADWRNCGIRNPNHPTLSELAGPGAPNYESYSPVVTDSKLHITIHGSYKVSKRAFKEARQTIDPNDTREFFDEDYEALGGTYRAAPLISFINADDCIIDGTGVISTGARNTGIMLGGKRNVVRDISIEDGKYRFEVGIWTLYGSSSVRPSRIYSGGDCIAYGNHFDLETAQPEAEVPFFYGRLGTLAHITQQRTGSQIGDFPVPVTKCWGGTIRIGSGWAAQFSNAAIRIDCTGANFDSVEDWTIEGGLVNSSANDGTHNNVNAHTLEGNGGNRIRVIGLHCRSPEREAVSLVGGARDYTFDNCTFDAGSDNAPTILLNDAHDIRFSKSCIIHTPPAGLHGGIQANNASLTVEAKIVGIQTAAYGIVCRDDVDLTLDGFTPVRADGAEMTTGWVQPSGYENCRVSLVSYDARGVDNLRHFATPPDAYVHGQVLAEVVEAEIDHSNPSASVLGTLSYRGHPIILLASGEDGDGTEDVLSHIAGGIPGERVLLKNGRALNARKAKFREVYDETFGPEREAWLESTNPAIVAARDAAYNAGYDPAYAAAYASWLDDHPGDEEGADEKGVEAGERAGQMSLDAEADRIAASAAFLAATDAADAEGDDAGSDYPIRLVPGAGALQMRLNGPVVLRRAGDFVELELGDDDRWFVVRERVDRQGNWLTPFDFGARGDGVHDDTNALLACGQASTTIVFPIGRFTTTAEIVMRQNTSFWSFQIPDREPYLNQSGTSNPGRISAPMIKWTGEANDNLTMIRAHLGTTTLTQPAGAHASNLYGISITGLTLDGDNKVGFGIFTARAHNCRIEDNLVINTTTSAFYFTNQYSGRFAHNFAFKNRGVGFSFGCAGEDFGWTGAAVNALWIAGNHAAACGLAKAFVSPDKSGTTEQIRAGCGFRMVLHRGNSFLGNTSEVNDGAGIVYTMSGNSNILQGIYTEKNGEVAVGEDRAGYGYAIIVIGGINGQNNKISGVFCYGSSGGDFAEAIYLTGTEPGRQFEGALTLEGISTGYRLIAEWDNYRTPNVSRDFTGYIQGHFPAANDADSITPFTPVTTLYVRSDGDNANNGRTTGTAFLTLQKAFDIARIVTTVTTIDVDGTTLTNQVVNGKVSREITVQNGSIVQGGSGQYALDARGCEKGLNLNLTTLQASILRDGRYNLTLTNHTSAHAAASSHWLMWATDGATVQMLSSVNGGAGADCNSARGVFLDNASTLTCAGTWFIDNTKVAAGIGLRFGNGPNKLQVNQSTLNPQTNWIKDATPSGSQAGEVIFMDGFRSMVTGRIEYLVDPAEWTADANQSYAWASHSQTIICTATLTAERTATWSTSRCVGGELVTVRNDTATAFAIVVNGFAVPPGCWIDLEYDATTAGWIRKRSGGKALQAASGTASEFDVIGDGASAVFRATRHQANSSGALFDGYKSRGTPSAPVVVQNGDSLAYFRTFGWDGTGFRTGVTFGGISREPGTISSTVFGAAAVIGTVAAGSATVTETLRAQAGVGWQMGGGNTVIDWSRRFISGASTEYTAAQIADIAHAVNTTGKVVGLLVWDTTNRRFMRARAALAASEWDAADGSVSVTPA